MLSKELKTIDDVKQFFCYLIHDLKLNFHPDTDFSDYISIEDEKNTFSETESSVLNAKMETCFEICEQEGVDIYEIGFETLKGSVMNEEQAKVVAEALGGTAWQSGGDIWLVLFEKADGKIVVISDEVVCEYTNHEAFENSLPFASILLC